jgi:hypothetical protein
MRHDAADSSSQQQPAAASSRASITAHMRSASARDPHRAAHDAKHDIASCSACAYRSLPFWASAVWFATRSAVVGCLSKAMTSTPNLFARWSLRSPDLTHNFPPVSVVR